MKFLDIGHQISHEPLERVTERDLFLIGLLVFHADLVGVEVRAPDVGFYHIFGAWTGDEPL